MSQNLIDNDAPTLDTVNANLLRKLNSMIESVPEDNTEALLNVVEAVAKLNASSKNNDKLGQPKTEQEKIDEELAKRFKDRLGEAQVIDGS